MPRDSEAAGRAWDRARASPVVVVAAGSSKEGAQQQQEAAVTPAAASSATPRILLAAVLAAAAVGILAASGGVAGVKERLAELDSLIESSGWLGYLLFGSIYTASTVLLFPASVLTLAAGALFGPVKGTALVSASATSGACAAFLVSRYLARPAVEARLAESPRFQAVWNSVARDGAKLVLLLRLSPLVPFGLLNYFLGITKISFGEYAVASWAGMLPGTFAYVTLGSLGKVAADAAADGSSGGSVDGLRLALYAVGGVATIWATKLISSAAASALEEQQADDSSGGGEPQPDER